MNKYKLNVLKVKFRLKSQKNKFISTSKPDSTYKKMPLLNMKTTELDPTALWPYTEIVKT